jgi:hypothetical protein
LHMHLLDGFLSPGTTSGSRTTPPGLIASKAG